MVADSDSGGSAGGAIIIPRLALLPSESKLCLPPIMMIVDEPTDVPADLILIALLQLVDHPVSSLPIVVIETFYLMYL